MAISTGKSSVTGDPLLLLPPPEQVVSSDTIAIAGASYTDSYAPGNPGAMFVRITDGNGQLYSSYPADAGATRAAAPGSGSHAITFNGSYADVQAIIAGLSYVGTTAGADDIHFDIWNQAGIETTGDVAVSVGSIAAIDNWTGAASVFWNAGANWSAGRPPKSGDHVTIHGGTPFNPSLIKLVLAGETITLADNAVVDVTQVTLDSLLQGNGTVTLHSALTIGTAGSLSPGTGGAIELNTGGAAARIINQGTIATTPGASLHIDNGGTVIGNHGTLVNQGLIAVDGGALDFALADPRAADSMPTDVLVNAGTVAISGGGLLWLNGTVSGGAVAFNGTGTLALEQSMAFANGAAVSGFGAGDAIELFAGARGNSLVFAGGTLDVLAVNGNVVEAIPFIGGYGLGNFELETIFGAGNPQIIAYVPDGGSSGGVAQPDIAAPALASVAQGATLSLGQVSISNLAATSDSIAINAGSGQLFMNGATGSGTSHLTLGPTTAVQINAELASLTYVPAAGASADTIAVTATPPVQVSTTRWIPITISSGPRLTEASGETVAANATVGVNGSYSDDYAAGNPGNMYLSITDDSGILSATDALGHAAPGSGSSNITVQSSYVDVGAILASLHYTAGARAGSATIHFDVWNQAGVETTADTAVTIDAANFSAVANSASSGMLENFALDGPTSSGVQTQTAGGSMTLSDFADQPIRLPLLPR
jgi:hypothetical protein